MKPLLLPLTLCGLLLPSCSQAFPPAGENPGAAPLITTAPGSLDLATTLRLAGAQNLDVEFAQQQLLEAQGKHRSEFLKYFPTLQPGIGYRRHDGNLQDTGGDILDVSRQSYAPGAAIVAELNLGEAIYKNLAAQQLTEARTHGIQRQRAESMLQAGLAYYDLAFANALQTASQDAVALSTDQEKQLTAAAEAGIALKSDILRITVQKERNLLIVRQAAELAATASARLARTLRLDPTVPLRSTADALSPIEMIAIHENGAAALVARAQAAHPSIEEAAALARVAEKERDATVIAPLIPTLTASTFVGGLGGGRGGDLGNFDSQHDTFIGLTWRIGAGGLFDRGREQAAEARLAQTRIEGQKTAADLAVHVAQAHAAALSARDRLATARRVLTTAEEVVKLSRERKEFGVGITLEMIQAGNDLALSRQDYLRSLADTNKAQLALAIYTGRLGASAK